MIASPAAFSLLLLSSLTGRLVYGEYLTHNIAEGQQVSSGGERQTRSSLRVPQKEKMGAGDESAIIDARSMQEEGAETAWPTYVPTSFVETSPEFIITSFEDGYMRDPTEGTISIEMETPWPTYVPTSFETRAPTIAIPTFGVASSSLNCDPIGVRTNYIPVRNNSATRPPTAHPMPNIDNNDKTPVPTKTKDIIDPTSTPRPTQRPITNTSRVTFRRGDLMKKIERLGIKGENWIVVHCATCCAV